MTIRKGVVVANGALQQIQTGDFLSADSLGSGSAGAGLKVLLDNNTWGTAASSFPIATAGGTSDVITATYSPVLTLVDKQTCMFVASAANTTTTPTFSPDGLTAHVITQNGGSALRVGDIPAALFVGILEYNLANTRWELLNPAKVTESDLSLSDNTTANVSTSKHGFVPKAPNTGLQVLLDTGAYGTPPSGNLVYSNTAASSAISNTTAETTFTIPSYTIPAGSLVAGSVIRIKLWGWYGTNIVSPNITAKIKLGGTTYLTTGAITAVANVSNAGWFADAVLTIFSIGSSGTVDAQGYAEFATAATTGLSVNIANTATQAINTTIAQAVTVTVQWSAASANNTITLQNAAIYIENLSTAATAGTFLQVANNLSDLNSATTARTNLGLTYTATVNWGASLSVTGFSATTVLSSYYTVTNDWVTIWFDITGTSNATTFTFALPFAPNANYGATSAIYPMTILDASTAAVGRVALASGSTTVTVSKSITGTAFTNSGGKACRGFLVYQK